MPRNSISARSGGGKEDKKPLTQSVTSRNRSSFTSPRKQRDVDASKTRANVDDIKTQANVDSNKTTAVMGNENALTTDTVIASATSITVKDNDGEKGESVVDSGVTTLEKPENEDVTESNSRDDCEIPNDAPLTPQAVVMDTSATGEALEAVNEGENEPDCEEEEEKEKVTTTLTVPPPEYPPPAEIFRTSKLFWQVKKNLDIHIFLHESEKKVIEIVALNSAAEDVGGDSHVFSRSYVNCKLVYRLMKLVVQAEEEKKQAEKAANTMDKNSSASKGSAKLSALDSLKMQNDLVLAEAQRERKKQEQRGNLDEDWENDSEDHRTKMLKGLCAHILERLKITEAVSEKGGIDTIREEENVASMEKLSLTAAMTTSLSKNTVKQLEYVARQGELELLADCIPGDSCGKDSKNEDDSDLTVTYTEKPWYIKPAIIRKKKMSTVEDRKAVMHALSDERAKLKEATSTAATAINLINMSIDAFSSLGKRFAYLRNANISKWKKKWIWAIRKVISQEAVKKYEAMWVAYCRKKEDGLSSITDRTGLTILAVDDTLTALKKTKHALENCKHIVTLAENGLMALKLMKENVYDLVLMDKEMPTMNGLQATREIRAFEQQNPGRKKQFIICLTGEVKTSVDELSRETRECGMDGLMIKPFAVQRFDEILERLSNERKALRASKDIDNQMEDTKKEDELRLARTTST